MMKRKSVGERRASERGHRNVPADVVADAAVS